MTEQELRIFYKEQGYTDAEIDIMLGVERDSFSAVEGLPFGCVPSDGKPAPNEYSCRMQNPGLFSSFARKNCYRRVLGKCVDFVFGIRGGKSELQSLKYKKQSWSRAAAKSHCADRDGAFEA